MPEPQRVVPFSKICSIYFYYLLSILITNKFHGVSSEEIHLQSMGYGIQDKNKASRRSLVERWLSQPEPHEPWSTILVCPALRSFPGHWNFSAKIMETPGQAQGWSGDSNQIPLAVPRWALTGKPRKHQPLLERIWFSYEFINYNTDWRQHQECRLILGGLCSQCNIRSMCICAFWRDFYLFVSSNVYIWCDQVN